MNFDLSQFGKRKEVVVTKDFKDVDDMDLNKLGDAENAHKIADELLIKFIGDDNIKKEYNKVKKWYS